MFTVIQVLNAGASASKDKSFVPQVSAGAEASLFKGYSSNATKPIESVEFDVGQAKAGAWATPLGAGVDVSANLFSTKASVFDCTLGVGASTGGGVKDDSVKVEVLGTGITVGRKIGISVLGSSFGIDFGRLF